ncbi:autotransporter outer membrane beta-barrel domain-containing protein [Fusobacterium necrogenes]|uniref:autotransporter outer membrane beta-barrel domain-containing protein n=1 Tax=Fusobacterium necrogenes TaxID=858 RepID=UPI00255CDF68|nr:autotransporter outer membrane beta-barrel domain-containing protein [Fusobacterium necrogenes]
MKGIDVSNVAFGTSSILDKVGVTFDGDIKIEIGKNLADVIVNATEPNPDPEPDPDPNPDPTDPPIDPNLPEAINYNSLNDIYMSIVANPENVTELKKLIGSNARMRAMATEQEANLLNFLAEVYTATPYSLSSELSRKSVENFSNIIMDKDLRPNNKKWSVFGGFSHLAGDIENSYFGQNKYTWDTKERINDVENTLTGLYAIGEYGVSDTFSLGLLFGANNLESKLANYSKVDGTGVYLSGFMKKYVGNFRLLAGIGYQYGDYTADRSISGVDKIRTYEADYNDKTLNLYTDVKYSHMLTKNLYIEPSIRLNYINISQDGVNESGALSIQTDSKNFDYTTLRFGVDLRKDFHFTSVKQSLSLGTYYEKMSSGNENEKITARFNGGSDFNLLVAGKDGDRIGVKAKYGIEAGNGLSFDFSVDYGFEKDINIGDTKRTNKGEWRIGAGLGYKF